jgi:hypothetical protein
MKLSNVKHKIILYGKDFFFETELQLKLWSLSEAVKARWMVLKYHKAVYEAVYQPLHLDV